MASQEIAVAYISLVPSMSGLQGNIAKEFAAVDTAAGRAGRSSGTAFTKAFGAVSKTVKVAATTAVAGAGVAMGVALTKGLGRLNAIDTAKAKLRGLGHDGEMTAKIMDNALASVKGTAFGLDEAATTAAGAVAAGIAPGKQLEDTLSTVANVAAATGRSMDDMGAVFNQVAAGGKAYTMQVKQIADAGLPIWQKLGEELGVTTDQVQKLVSAGEVDFPTFERAAAAAAGTVALEVGQTLPGAFDNAMAAFSRFGANVWKGFDAADGSYTGIYGKLADLVMAFTSAMGPIEDVGSKIGDFLGEKLGPILDTVTGWLNRFGDAGEGAGSRFRPLLNALGPATAMLGALGAGGLGPLLSGLPVVGKLLGPLPGLLGKIGGPAGIAAAGLFALSQVDPHEMAQGFAQIGERLPEIISGMTDKIAHFAGDVIPTLVEGITTSMPVLVAGVSQLVATIGETLTESLPLIVEAVADLFLSLVTVVSEILPELVVALVDVITELVPVLLGLVPVLLEGAIELFTALIDALAEILEPLVAAVIELLPVVIDTLISLIPLLIDGALQLFMAIVEALPLIIPLLVVDVVALIPTIIEALLSALPELIDGAVQLFTGIIEALPIILPELVAGVAALVPEMVTALINGVPSLLQAGKDLIGGLISGIGDMASAAVESVKDLGGQILGGIKGFFGISSPSKVMAQIGGFLDKGLAGGIGKGAGSVAAMKQTAKQVEAVTQALQRSVQGTAQAVGAQVNRIIQSLRQLTSMMSGAFRSAVQSSLTQVGRQFQTILPQAVTQMVSRMRSGLGGLQTWFGGPFRSSLVSAVNAIKTAFLAVPGAVTSSWSRLRAGTAIPTNYVISTVYMRGIRSAVNAISSAVGVKSRMPAVASVGYASGGVLPGYTPGKDVHDFYNPQYGFLRLSGGEGILRPEVVRELGGAATINAWNAARGPITSCGDRGYASGGIIDFLRPGSTGWSVNTGGDFQFHALENPRNTIKQLVQEPARSYAARSAGGDWGRAAGGSMVNLAGLYAAVFSKLVAQIAGGGTGLVAAARKAIGVPYIWGGSSIPPGLDCSGLVYWAYQQMGKRGVPRLTAAGYRSAGIPTGSPRPGDLAFNASASHVGIVSGAGRMVHAPRPGEFVREQMMSANMNNFARMRYDSGGWLMPGFTLAENRTGRPEPVLTSEQWSRMDGVTVENITVDFSSARSVLEIAEYVEGLGLDLRLRGVSVGG